MESQAPKVDTHVLCHREALTVRTSGRSLIDISARVREVVRRSGVHTGLCTAFIHHTSASLVISENADPDVCRDLEAYLQRLVQDGDPLYRHDAEGPDDMAAHIRSVLTQTSISIPVAHGRLELGTWQGLYVWEHRYTSHERRITLTTLGSSE